MTSDACPTSHVFYAVRRVLMRELNLDRQSIRPDTRLADIIPFDREKAIWDALHREGMKTPAHSIRTAQAKYPRLLLPVWPLLWLSRKYAEIAYLEWGPYTLHDLVIDSVDFAQLVRRGHRFSHDEITTKVRLIISDALGIPLGSVQPETSFAELERL
jgi:hypothetical protein